MPANSPYNENELLHRLASGDEQAFTSLYELTYPTLYYYTKRFVTEEKAKDIVAESYVKLWKARPKFDSLSHVNSYLRSIARNLSIDQLHQQSREEKLHEQLNFLTEEEYDNSYLSRDEIEALLYKKILDEIEQLPPFTQTIFKLAYIEGKTNAEIADLLQIKDQTVRNKKAEALKIIRNRLPNLPLLIVLKYFFHF